MMQFRHVIYVKLTVAWCLSMVLGVSVVKAQQPDKISIKADSLHYDQIKQISVFNGNVQAVYEQMMLKGDKLTLTQKKDSIYTVKIEGTPATLFDKSSQGDEVHAEAFVITAETPIKVFQFMGKARVERKKIDGSIDVLQGDKIDVDWENKKYAAQSSSSDNRVQLDLIPNGSTLKTP